MKYLKIFSVLLPILVLGISTGYVASDGVVGTSSTGTSTLTVEVPAAAMISGLTDIIISSAGDLSTAEATNNVCVYANNSNGYYNITANSENPGTDGTNDILRLINGAGDYLEYGINWNGTNRLFHNTPVNFDTANNSSITCGGGTNKSFQVYINPEHLQASPSGTYNDTITFVVQPGNL